MGAVVTVVMAAEVMVVEATAEAMEEATMVTVAEMVEVAVAVETETKAAPTLDPATEALEALEAVAMATAILEAEMETCQTVVTTVILAAFRDLETLDLVTETRTVVRTVALALVTLAMAVMAIATTVPATTAPVTMALEAVALVAVALVTVAMEAEVEVEVAMEVQVVTEIRPTPSSRSWTAQGLLASMDPLHHLLHLNLPLRLRTHLEHLEHPITALLDPARAQVS